MSGTGASDDDEGQDTEVSGAVIRECIVNLAKVKERVQDFVKSPDQRDKLEPIPDLVQQIRAGLGLLELERAGEILQAAAFFIRDRIFGSSETPPQDALDRLADAIVSTEFYLETIQQGRGRPESMLDNAEHCISEIGYRPGALPAEEASSQPADEAPAESAAPADSDATAGDELTIEMPGEEAGGDDSAADASADEDGNAAADPEAAEKPAPAPQQQKRKVPPADEVAPEIVEVFLEEAEEELASLRENYPRWKNNPEDNEALTTVRRSFHTLKGSGRMVGAEFIGEFSWSFENMLNRIIDKTIDARPAMIDLVGEAIEAIPELVTQLKGEGEPEVDAYGLMETADAYSRGEEPASSGATPDLHGGDLEVDEGDDQASAEPEAPSEPEAADADSEPGEAEASDTDDDELSFSLDEHGDDSLDLEEEDDLPSLEGLSVDEGEAEDSSREWASEAAPSEPDEFGDDEEPAMDPVLYDIFRKEADQHLGTLDKAVEEIAEEPEISRELLRALHTLNGSAHTADVEEIPQIVGPLERAAREMQDEGIAPDENFANVLRDSVAAVRGMIEGLGGSAGAPAPDPELLERIQSLKPGQAPAGEAAEPAAEAEPSDRSDASEPAPAPRATTRRPSEIPLEELPDYDEELAEVFMEEAQELQEAMDEAIQDWHGDHDDGALVAALQRHLHTLKGGARMSGLTPMGDLSHEMETVLTKAVDGKLPVSTEMTSLIQRCVDRVHKMVEQVGAGSAIIDGSDLVDELRRLHARGGEVFEGEAEPTESPQPEEAEAPAEVPEPEAPKESGPSVAPEPAEPEAPQEAAEQKSEPRGGLDAVEEHGERRASPRVQQEVVRVRADLLENLLNNAGEVSIYRARVEQQLSNMDFHLKELDQTVDRLRQQFRNLEIEIEAQVRYQWEKEEGATELEFDPLELDRYSQLQQLSRALQESVSDLVSLQGLLSNHAREAETLLVQQSRVNTDLQDGLMRTRMLPFSRHAQRLRRLVRQTAAEQGKQVELRLIGGEGEMDRQVLERIVAPLEHMLRNSVIHGLETPEDRDNADKPEEGLIAIELHREGSEVVIEVMDDGRGLNVDKIRKRAEKMGLVRPGTEMSESDTIQFILEPGFSTAETITQSAGRGVGMDVVHSEIKQLGGSLHMTSSEGVGTRFTVRLPYTLAITQALMVNVADEVFAIPLPSIEGIVRIPREELEQKLGDTDATFRYGGRDYELQHLSGLLGFGRPSLPEDAVSLPVLLVRVGDHAAALVTEGMRGSREVVVKSVGPQIANIRGISGATIMGDGSIVLILDVGGMVRGGVQAVTADMDETRPEPAADEPPTVMVVDDSITVRRVTERLLKRYGLEVMTAKDGVDALAELQDRKPDVMLLDIEMPRMDGYELATHMRNDDELRQVPIIMITSRTGDKHRNRAFEIGVDRYLGKPYQETELMENIRSLIGEFDPRHTRTGSTANE